MEGIAAQAGELKEDTPDEERVVLEIALPEPARLLDQAIEPFEAAALNPAWRLADIAADQVEGRANADHDGDIKDGQGRGHEVFLLGCAQADPDDVGLRGGDLGLKGLELGRCEGAEGRRMGADDLQPGKLGLEDGSQGVRRAGTAAVEEVFPSRPLRGLADFEKKIGTVDSLHILKTGPSADPDHGHSVRSIEVGVVEDGAKGGIRLRFGDAVDAGNADVALGPIRNCGLQGDDSGAEIEGMHTNAQDVDARRRNGHRLPSVTGPSAVASQKRCGGKAQYYFVA